VYKRIRLSFDGQRGKPVSIRRGRATVISVKV
jgi:hypothetical protein